MELVSALKNHGNRAFFGRIWDEMVGWPEPPGAPVTWYQDYNTSCPVGYCHSLAHIIDK